MNKIVQSFGVYDMLCNGCQRTNSKVMLSLRKKAGENENPCEIEDWFLQQNQSCDLIRQLSNAVSYNGLSLEQVQKLSLAWASLILKHYSDVENLDQVHTKGVFAGWSERQIKGLAEIMDKNMKDFPISAPIQEIDLTGF